jgi:ADP-dependent NAD(P)H-hydrate dehydratase / NAD(P)H-hydrate epimerase
MKLVNRKLMRDIDSAAIEGAVRGVTAIPVLELMEYAGKALAEAIVQDFLESPAGSAVAIFCGKGNNGGDGLVIARYLAGWGADVSVYLTGESHELSGASQANLTRLQDTDVKVKCPADSSSLPESLQPDLIVDALLGSGAEGALRGLTLDLALYINQQSAPVCAIDNPTGLDIDSGAVESECVAADFTYSLAVPKIGHYMFPGKSYAGVARTIDIGIPQEVVDSFAVNENLITPEYVAENLPSRPPDAHKGTFGRLFALTSSKGMTGAGALSAKAALRAGAGIVTVGCPDSLEQVYEIKLDEAMTLGLPSVAKRGALSLRALGAVLTALNKSTAALIGPGLGRHRETERLIQRVVAKMKTPCVLDADGLNAFEKDTTVLDGNHAPLILTPHDGEFERLTGEFPPANFSERAKAVRDVAKKFNSVVLLKGGPTLIADPEGNLYLNPTGNSGMATGGSGDVLAGIITALLAQGNSPIQATLNGAYLHGLSGDLAASELGERSLIAGDLIEFLPVAFDLTAVES